MKIRITNFKRATTTMTVLFFILFTMNCKSIAKEYRNTELYEVAKGETIWSIARENKQDNEDIREYVSKVREINNNLSCDLRIGQTIEILK